MRKRAVACEGRGAAQCDQDTAATVGGEVKRAAAEAPPEPAREPIWAVLLAVALALPGASALAAVTVPVGSWCYRRLRVMVADQVRL